MPRPIPFLLILTLSSLIAGKSALAQGQLDQVMDTSLQMLKSGRPLDAVAYLQRASAQFPQSASIHFQMGNGYSDAKNYQAAVTEYNEALRLQPRFPASVLNIAYAYVNAGQYDLAGPWFERYLRESPTASNQAEVRAQMLMAQAAKCARDKRFFDAKKLLEQACAVNPSSSTAHFKLARACDELGDTDRAIGEYENCLRLKPDYSPAIFNIAGCYQTLGRTREAMLWFQKYLNQEPNAPDRATVQNMIAKLSEKGNENRANPHSLDYMDSIVENGRLYRWPMQRLPLKVFVDSGATVPTFREAYRTALLESLSAWSQATQNKLTFVLVPDGRFADIICQWTGNPYDVRQNGGSNGGSDVEQGVCFMEAMTNKRSRVDSTITRANLRILTIDRETLKPISDDDMKKTCLHELGHALGLRGHSSNNHDIMFFSVSPTVWPVLSKRDKATLLQLYSAYPQQQQQQRGMP